MRKYLQVIPHPTCCGCYIIGYFGYSTTNVNSTGLNDLSTLEAELISCERDIGKGIVQVILNDEQVPHVEYLLEKHGYTCVVKDSPGKMRLSLTKESIESNLHTNNIYVKQLTPSKNIKVGSVGFHGKNERVNNETPRTNTVKPAASAAPKAPRPLSFRYSPDVWR